MKRFLAIAGDTLLIFCAAIGSLGTLITAFSLPVSTSDLVVILLCAAVIVSVVVSFFRVKGFLALLALVILPVVIEFPKVIEGARSVIFVITSEYSKWLFVPMLYPGSMPAADEVTVFFVVTGLIVTLLLSSAICLRRSTLLMVFYTIPFVLAAFVLVTTPPDIRFAMILLAAYFVMLIGGALRPDSAGRKETAVFPAIALTLILLGVAGLLAPQGNRSDNDLTRLLDIEIRLFLSRAGLLSYDIGIGWPMSPDGIWEFDTSNVNISNAGFRHITDTELLEITVSEPGVFYLMGFTMDWFDGQSWHQSAETAPTVTLDHLSRALPAAIAYAHMDLINDSETVAAFMTIEQLGDRTQGVSYIPYYSFPPEEDEFHSFVEFYHNADKSIAQMHTQLNEEVGGLREDLLYRYTAWINGRGLYTQVQETTAEALRAMAADAGIDMYAGREVIVGQVADFIRSSANYTLRPNIIPGDYDFSLYFLEISKEGYCIHFATAATLMLRALGVPARFATGYAVAVPAGDAGSVITLTDRHAHSWVEVYYEDIGWIPVEVTPFAAAAGDAVPTAPTRTPAAYPSSEPPAWEDEYTRPYETPDLDSSGSSSIPVPEIDASEGFSQERGRVILIALSAAGFLMLVSLRVFVLRRIRAKRFSRADANAAVICVRRYIVRLDRKAVIPPDIEDIALKARFSQHTVSEEERAKVIEYSVALRQRVHQDRTFIGRFVMSVFWGM